jgi:hypothetical protein
VHIVVEEEGFKDLQGQVLLREAASRQGDMADFSLSNLTDCTVYICAPLRAIRYASSSSPFFHSSALTCLRVRRMYNLKSCSVFVGPVAGSALLYDCQGCSFSIASQQVRLSIDAFAHSSRES